MKAKTTLASIFALLLVLAACSGGTAATTTESGEEGERGGSQAPGTVTTDNSSESKTTQPGEHEGGGEEVACTAIGCESIIFVELTKVDLTAESTYGVEICVDGDCRYETITIGSADPSTGSRPVGESQGEGPGREKMIRLDAETDTVTYHLPAVDHGETADVYFAITDADGEVLVEAESAEVHLERFQPNGPDCPPVCFSGHLAI